MNKQVINSIASLATFDKLIKLKRSTVEPLSRNFQYRRQKHKVTEQSIHRLTLWLESISKLLTVFQTLHKNTVPTASFYFVLSLVSLNLNPDFLCEHAHHAQPAHHAPPRELLPRHNLLSWTSKTDLLKTWISVPRMTVFQANKLVWNLSCESHE